MTRQKSQQGFSVLVLVVALLAATTLGFTGFYVWNKNQDQDKKSTQNVTATNNAKQQTSSNNSPQKEDAYAGWKSYSNSTYGISFKYPTQWKVEEGSFDSPASATRQEYAVNTSRDIEEKYNGSLNIEVLDEPYTKAAEWYDAAYAQSASNEVDKQFIKLKDKNTIKYVVANNGTKSIVYLFEVHNKTYSIESVNEWLNLEKDSSYWTLFNGVVDSLQIE
jgi:Tfp pilus assembly protein PilV